MRIGLVSGEYPPMQGGVGAFTRELAIGLRDLGHEIHVFTRAESGASHEPGIAISASAGKRWGWGTIAQVNRWASGARLDILNIQFQTAAFDMHPSIHWTPRRVIASGIPTVTTFHDLRAPYLFPKAGPVRALSVRLLARWSSGAIATDHADEDRLKNEWMIPHVRWIPIGSNVSPVPADRIERDTVRAGLGVGKGQLLISYFGFLNETKGALFLIQALDQLVRDGIDAHLVMIGGRAGASDPTNWEYGQRVDEAIAAKGLSERVHWSGFVDDTTVSSYFYASDVTGLPYLDGASLRRGTLMAALAHGRAIVTTTPVSQELDGVVDAVPPANPEALCGAIKRLWQEPSRRASLERASAKASEQFNWGHIAQATQDFYRERLGQ